MALTLSIDAAPRSADAADLAGPADRFHAVVDRHFDAVAAFLTRRVGPDVAQDLAQETFVAAFKRRDRFDARYDSARPWLLGIATKAVAGHRREERRQLELYRRVELPEVDFDAARRATHERIDVLAAKRRRPRRLPALTLAATAAAAAAVLLTTGGTPTTMQPTAATAATVLHALGQRAADLPSPQLAPGEYYAVRVNQYPADGKHDVSRVDNRTWADGTKGREQILVNGKSKLDVPLGTPPADGAKYKPFPDLASFPTEPAALAAKLREVVKAGQVDPSAQPTTRDYLVTAMQMIFDHRQTPPDVLRGIYDILAGLPGIRLIGDVTDPLGRPGKAVAIDGDAQIHEGIGIELILAPDTGLPLAAVHYHDGDVTKPWLITTRQEGVVTGTDTLP